MKASDFQSLEGFWQGQSYASNQITKKKEERKMMSFSSPPLQGTHTPAKPGSDTGTAYTRKKGRVILGQNGMAINVKRS